MGNGVFKGQQWQDNGDGTYTKTAPNGEQLHSDKTDSNRQRSDDHIHTYPDGAYSVKSGGSNVGGSNETIFSAIAVALGINTENSEDSED